MHGRCITFTPPEGSRRLTLGLDAMSDEYLTALSPSVGFTLFLHNPKQVPTLGKQLKLSPGHDTTVKVEQVRVELIKGMSKCQ